MNAMVFTDHIKVFEKNKKKLKEFDKVYFVTKNCSIKDMRCGKKYETITVDYNGKAFLKEATEIISQINSVISNTKTRKESYLYELSYQIEGGASQQIADLIYVLHYLKEIVKHRKIDYIFCEDTCLDEVRALRSIAKENGIAFQILSRGVPIAEHPWNLILPSCLCAFLRQIKSVLKIIYLKTKCRKTVHRHKYEIAVSYYSDLKKHINWQIDEISEYEGKMNYCIFCLGSYGAYRDFRKAGMRARMVEEYASLTGLLRDYFIFCLDLHVLRKAVDDTAFTVFGIDISNEIYRIVMYYFSGQTVSHVFYDHMIDELIEDNSFSLMTGNGNTNFIHIRMYYELLKKKNRKTVLFHDERRLDPFDMTDYHIAEPDSNEMRIRFFCKNDLFLPLLIKNGWSGKYFFVSKNKKLKMLKNICPLRMKRKRPVFLWAPSNPMMGFYSVHDFLKDDSTMLEKISNEECDLYVKYHPGWKVIQTDDTRKYKKYANIHFVDANEPIEKYIKMADLVFTTPSTVIYDAAECGKLVVCVTCAAVYHFVAHLSEHFILQNRDDVDVHQFVELCSNHEKTENYYKRCVDKQIKYMLSIYSGDKDNCIYRILKDEIQRMKYNQDNYNI